jgi:hypothetical protein
LELPGGAGAAVLIFLYLFAKDGGPFSGQFEERDPHFTASQPVWPQT